MCCISIDRFLRRSDFRPLLCQGQSLLWGSWLSSESVLAPWEIRFYVLCFSFLGLLNSVIFPVWKKGFAKSPIAPTPGTEQGLDAEQMCFIWGKSIARGDDTAPAFCIWSSLITTLTDCGALADPSGNWIGVSCAKSFTICHLILTLIACCQAWTCSFVSIRYIYWLGLPLSVKEDVLWVVDGGFVSCDEGLVNDTWAGKEMFDGDGTRLMLFEEGKSFSCMVVKGEKSLGLKMNLSLPLGEGGMGCLGWQYSDGKRCTQNQVFLLLSLT